MEKQSVVRVWPRELRERELEDTPINYFYVFRDTIMVEPSVDFVLRDVLERELDDTQKNYFPVFHDAIKNGNLRVVRLFVENGVPVNGLNGKPCPLCTAVESDSPEIFEYLLQKGASASSACPLGTPMKTAVQHSRSNFLRLLFKYRGTAANDASLLANAVIKGDPATLEAMLQNGFDVNWQLPSKGRRKTITLGWHHWTVTSFYENCKYSRDEDIINATKDRLSGGRPLHIAITLKLESIVRLLVNYGADVNTETDEGLTPLVLATNEWIRCREPRNTSRSAVSMRNEEVTWNIVAMLLQVGARMYSDVIISNFKSPWFLLEESGFIIHAFVTRKCRGSSALPKDPPSSEEVWKAFVHDVANERFFLSRDNNDLLPLVYLLSERETKMAHAAWVVALNDRVLGGRPVPRDKFLYRVGVDPSRSANFLEECEEEVARMKATALTVDEELGPQVKIDESFACSYTVYDLLTLRVMRVARLFRNGAVSGFVDSDEFQERFPIYGGWIKDRNHKRHVRGEIVDRVLATYCLAPNSLAVLPPEVLERDVFRYLSTQELKILVDLFKLSEPPRSPL